MEFLIGGLAGAVTPIFTNPIDVVKIRLQLQGELRSVSKTTTKYRGTLHALYVIARTDGISALQKGLGPAMLLGFVMNTISLGLYRIAELNGFTRNTNGNISVHKAMLCSALCGMLSGICCNPISIIKIRIQTEAHPSIAVGRQYKYKGALDGFVKIYKAEGVKGWFTGVAATATRLSIGCAAQLTTFSKTKEMLLSKGFFQTSPFGLALASSAVSGIAIALVACPFDVAAVRLYNQSLSRKGQVLYTGVLDCLIKIYKTEGLYGFYKGIAPLYLKLAPNTTIPLVIWDVLNTLQHKNKNI